MTAEPLEDANPGVWALAYAELGWRALLITPGKKWPPMQSWPHAASTNPGTIRSWVKALYRGFGVGIATGEGSGIFATDIVALLIALGALLVVHVPAQAPVSDRRSAGFSARRRISRLAAAGEYRSFVKGAILPASMR